MSTPDEFTARIFSTLRVSAAPIGRPFGDVLAIVKEIEASTRAKAFEEAANVVEAGVNSYIPLNPARYDDGSAVHVCRSRLAEKIRSRAKESSP